MAKNLITRRSFLKIGGTAMACVPILASNVIAAEPIEKPNIVFILADDLGWHQLGCYGSKFYETPNIDKLSKHGTRFTDAYAACSVCSPTRASIMTGKYPARLHLTDYIPGRSPKGKKLLTPEWTKHLPMKEVTIAESLKSVGYVTAHFGKWHQNIDKKYEPGRPGDPGSQGFNEVLTTHKPGAGSKSNYDEDWHHVKEITERTTAFIERNKAKPFFCYVSHNSIHAPEIEKSHLVEKYNKKPGAKFRGRDNPKQAAMLETLDNSVGDIVKKIKDLGIERKTIVIFFSDNGHLGTKTGRPFRGSKGDLYEGGIRMPLIIKWPGIVRAGSECHEVVISNDFFPTFNEIAGASPDVENIDGISLVSLLKDHSAELDREAIYWHYPHYHGSGLGPQGAIRSDGYKLIEWFEKSAYNEEGAFELYDLNKDPAEQKDLAATHPEITERLKKALSSWRGCVDAQMMAKNR